MKLRKNLVLPLVLGIIIGSVTTASAGNWISAYKNTEMKITYNGEAKTFVDSKTNEIQTPIVYNDRTYLPVRAIAELTGLTVNYEDQTKTVKLQTSDYTEPKDPGTFNIANDKFLSAFSFYDSIPNWYVAGNNIDDGYKSCLQSLYSSQIKSLTDSDISQMIHTNSPVRDTLISEVKSMRDTLISNPTITVSTSNYKTLKYIFKSNLLQGAISSIDVNVYNNGQLIETTNKKILIVADYTAGKLFSMYGIFIPQ